MKALNAGCRAACNGGDIFGALGGGEHITHGDDEHSWPATLWYILYRASNYFYDIVQQIII